MEFVDRKIGKVFKEFRLENNMVLNDFSELGIHISRMSMFENVGLFIREEVWLEIKNGKGKLSIFRNRGDTEFLDTATSNLPKILAILIDEYKDLWDKTWQKFQKYSGKCLSPFNSHKCHSDCANFHMSTA